MLNDTFMQISQTKNALVRIENVRERYKNTESCVLLKYQQLSLSISTFD